jgi:EAL domain-containing protein (putative c-di-GMP-specific phosphodiesterase class I)
VLQDLEESARFVSSVRDLGCAVALDDFGAGYTSFRNLQALAVDMVKIDGAFITDLEDKPDNQLFIRTLLGLARGFGLTTVAECVETEAEAEILKREGVTYLQGYLYGRPELTRPANNKIISLAGVQKPKPKLEISTAS